CANMQQWTRRRRAPAQSWNWTKTSHLVERRIQNHRRCWHRQLGVFGELLCSPQVALSTDGPQVHLWRMIQYRWIKYGNSTIY
ncbi:hypothetical protein T265_06519, partial [Opisthorchis viverrini]